ncbi:hypothetical protein D3C87_1193370 [compost metagenome]
MHAHIVVRRIDAHGVLHQRGEIHRLHHFLAGAGVVEELADDGVHLLDVGDHGVARDVVHRRHLGLEPQPGERGAQVVGDAGQHDHAVVVELAQVPHHLVEAAVGLGHLAGAVLAQRRRIAARADLARRVGQPLERVVHARRDEGRADDRQQQRGDTPPQPLDARHALEALRADGDPVVVPLDLEADPHARNVVDGGGEHGVLAQPPANLLLHQLGQEGVGGGRGEVVVLLARIDLDALVLHQVEQQETPPRRVGIEQGRARELDHADHLHGDLLGARRAFEEPVALEPDPQRDRQQEGDQHEGAPEQRTKEPRCGTAESGRHDADCGRTGTTSRHRE